MGYSSLCETYTAIRPGGSEKLYFLPHRRQPRRRSFLMWIAILDGPRYHKQPLPGIDELRINMVHPSRDNRLAHPPGVGIAGQASSVSTLNNSSASSFAETSLVWGKIEAVPIKRKTSQKT